MMRDTIRDTTRQKEVFEDPQVLAQEMMLEVDHPGRGSVKMTGFPVKLSETPARIHRPTPELGADTSSVLDPLITAKGN